MVIELWSFLGFWLRAIGFLLLFLGTLVVVVAATPGGGCFTSLGSCGTGFLGQAANGVYAAKLLWVLGLGGIGAGAGIRLHWGLRSSRDQAPEELQLIAASRKANWTAVILSIVLLLVLTLTSGLFLLFGPL